MKHHTALFALLLLAATSTRAEDYVLRTFQKTQLTDKFTCEGAHFGDFNHDGKMDVISGPYWYEGPEFKTRHEFYPAVKPDIDPHGYSHHFLTYVADVNGDGWDDILVLGWPGQDCWWYENPQGKSELWTQHVIAKKVDNESPTVQDITGTKKPALVCSVDGTFGYFLPDAADVTKLWTFHKISGPKATGGQYTHGLGVGDVNGDGKPDLLEASGWWEQPASLDGDPVWKKHDFRFAAPGGSQMFAYDVDGDGLNDVITSENAHGYGLVWWQQVKTGDKIDFKKHVIIGAKPEDSPYGVKFSQMHGVDLVDMDGDGLKDIVTGKRYWAHGPTGDVEPGAPAVLYWFQLKRDGKGGTEFVPHLIDDNSGVGTQVTAGDINGDKLPDVVVGNKKGTFIFIQQAKPVSKDEWEKAQPQRKP